MVDRAREATNWRNEVIGGDVGTDYAVASKVESACEVETSSHANASDENCGASRGEPRFTVGGPSRGEGERSSVAFDVLRGGYSETL